MDRAWQRYDLETDSQGVIRGVCSTNDDNDDGYPDGNVESWEVEYRDRETMLARTHGGSHYGISGVKVDVILDGEKV